MNHPSKTRPLKVSKLDAARRQIESAIWLWFVDADIVSVNTLAAAAHRLLCELSKRRGLAALPMTRAYFATKSEKTNRSTRDPEAYFKEAQLADTYPLDEMLVELSLFDAVMAYANLFERESGSALMSTFVVRFGVQRPELFAHDVFRLLEKNVDETFNIERLQKLSKMEFLEEFFGFLRRPAA